MSIGSKYRFKIGKLVRDKSKASVQAAGIESVERIMEHGEYLERLKDKLIEEAHEVVAAADKLELEADKSELEKELADVLEVVMAICKAHGISFEDVEKARLAKRERLGGFEGRVYAVCAEMDQDNPRAEYYLSQPDKYPQVEG